MNVVILNELEQAVGEGWGRKVGGGGGGGERERVFIIIF